MQKSSHVESNDKVRYKQTSTTWPATNLVRTATFVEIRLNA